MEAAQANVYHAPVSRVGIMRPAYAPMNHPLQETRGADAPFKGVRAHSTHKGEETGGGPASREETSPLSIRTPHLRPLAGLSGLYGDASFAEIRESQERLAATLMDMALHPTLIHAPVYNCTPLRQDICIVLQMCCNTVVGSDQFRKMQSPHPVLF